MRGTEENLKFRGASRIIIIIGLAVSLAMLVAGMVMEALSGQGTFSVLLKGGGLAVILLIPPALIINALRLSLEERDFKHAAVAAIVIALMIAGFLLGKTS